MSLPLTWIDRIFEKMTLTYGREFLNRWDGLPVSDVKTDWGHELAGFENWPEAIAFALKSLPAKPPTVIEFREIARKAPKPDRPALPEPPASKDRVDAEMRKLAPVKQAASGPYDHKAWAKRIIHRHQLGERLNPTTLRFAREALGLEPSHA